MKNYSLLSIGFLLVACQPQQIIEENKANQNLESRYKEAVISNPRIANIAANVMKNLEQASLDERYMAYVIRMGEIINSPERNIDTYYYTVMMQRGVSTAYDTVEGGYLYSKSWHIDVAPGSPYANEPPLMTQMSFQNETIPYAQCESSEKPVLMYVEAYREPNHANVGVYITPKAEGYVVKFNGQSELDDTIYNRSIIYDIGCQRITKN